MTNYEVHFTGHVSIEAENLSEAKLAFENKGIAINTSSSAIVQPTAFHNLDDDSESISVQGICEICEFPILDGEEFSSDEEGVMFHQECIDEDDPGSVPDDDDDEELTF